MSKQNKYSQQRTFNAKLQYSMDKDKHARFLQIIKEKKINLAVFVRQKIDRCLEVNSHICVDYETKQKFVKYLTQEGLTFSKWIDGLANEVITSNSIDICEEEE